MLKSIAMSNLRMRALPIFILIACGLTFWLGFWTRGLVSIGQRFDLLNEAYVLLEANYIEDLPEGPTLERGMVGGMLDSLGDPFTQYVEPQQSSIQADNLAGEYGGIGVLITSDGEGNFYLDPFPDGPAALAGIEEGVQLVAVDGIDLTEGTSLESVVAMLRGPEGSSLRIRFLRPGGSSSEEVRLTRVNIPLPSVSDFLLPGYDKIGVIAIHGFSEKTAEEFETSLMHLNARGAEYLILDLRNNGGGLLESAVSVSRILLSEGKIVAEERKGSIQKSYSVEKPGEYSDIPLAVVVDGTTASAAEVVASAIQANGRAFLIGDHTFGKGSVQVVVELSEGSTMRITSSRWLTSQGKRIDEEGLTPDIQLDVEAASSEKALFIAAELLLEGMDQE